MDFISTVEIYLGNTFVFSQEVMYLFKGIIVLMLVLPLVVVLFYVLLMNIIFC